MLRWPHFRRLAQGVTLVVAVAVVADGLLGPQMSPMNLAGVIPWTYWRGFTVVALLVAGNLFCLACPFMLPRALARWLVAPLQLVRRQWPRRLRSKWLAVTLLVAFFWAYEVLDLWDSPWWTAWLIIAYFAAALIVDALFQGASFCKYVCPIGQFQFIQSLVSPFEVRVREPQACARCTTHDCLRGNPQRRGCELDLFLPRKVGNLDCTFCLDCVYACPHDNVGIVARLPGETLADDGVRSGIGSLRSLRARTASGRLASPPGETATSSRRSGSGPTARRPILA
jgi:polyferredoxin